MIYFKLYISKIKASVAISEQIGGLFTTILALSLAAIWLTFAAIVCQSYAATWKSSSLFVTNVAALLEQDIARDIESYDLALKSTADTVRDPSVETLAADLKRRILFSPMKSADGLGSILVLDANGNATFDSRSEVARPLNAAREDYFQVHVDGRFRRELFVSHPFMAAPPQNMWTIGVSRRLDNPDGSFSGVVLGMLRLSYFSKLFAAVDMPPDGMLSIVHDDGTILMRSPFVGIGGSIRETPIFGLSSGAGAGEFTAKSPLDRVKRLYAYRRIGRFPMSVQIGIPVARFLDSWRWRMAFIAFGFFVLSGLIVVMAVALGRELSRRALAERTLSDLAATDGLTALANRRHFDEVLDQEWRRAIRDQTPVGLLMIDGDFFKAFNDTYGHLEGDKALKLIAGALRDSVGRPADLAARFGGEEFAVLLPGTDLDGAILVGETVRAAVERLECPHRGSPLGQLTVSIGAASCLPSETGDALSLIQAADFALYEAKEGGRDRVATSERLDLADFNWRAPVAVAN